MFFFSPHPAVKPDPPERVTATPVRLNARRLEVSWHSPSTWPDIDNFPLKYFLRYRPLIREQWQHVSSSQANKAKRIVEKEKKETVEGVCSDADERFRKKKRRPCKFLELFAICEQ